MDPPTLMESEQPMEVEMNDVQGDDVEREDAEVICVPLVQEMSAGEGSGIDREMTSSQYVDP